MCIYHFYSHAVEAGFYSDAVRVVGFLMTLDPFQHSLWVYNDKKNTIKLASSEINNKAF